MREVQERHIRCLLRGSENGQMGPDTARAAHRVAAMNDGARSKAELLAEVGRLRQRVTELESSTRMMRRAMETLRETDGSYRLVVEEFPQGIVIVKDGPARVIYANEAAARIMGQGVEDLMKVPARDWLDFVHDEDRERVAQRFAGGIARLREPVTTAFRMVRPDGVERLVELSANRLHTKGRDTVHATFADVTDLQEVAAEEETPPHLQGVFQVAPHACYFTDLNGVFVDCNPAAEALLGLAPDEPAGRGLLDPGFLSKPDRARVRELLKQSAKGKPTGPDEFVFTRADGSSVAVEISTQPIEVDGGTLVLAMAVDVTGARKAREALTGQQERFELLLNTVFDGINICEYDPETRRKRLVYCNDRFVEMSGYSRAELEEAEDLNELFDHRLTPEELDKYHKLIVKGKPYRGTSSWRRPDGAENAHEYSAVSVPAGDKFQLVGVDRDITEKVRAGQALEESERRFRGLVETSFDGINICEHDPATRARRLLFCNDRFVEMSGRSREELMGLDDLRKVLGTFLPPEQTEELDRRMLEGDLVRGLATWHRPDGRPNVYEYAAVAVPVGDKLHIYGFDRDITEQRQVEEALRESEERFRMVVSNVQDGINICEWDPEAGTRRLIWCNDSFVEMSGYSREELMAAESLEDLVVVNRTLDEGDELDRRIAEGKAFRGLASWKRPDGADNQYEFTAVAVPDGDVYRIYGVDRDRAEGGRGGPQGERGAVPVAGRDRFRRHQHRRVRSGYGLAAPHLLQRPLRGDVRLPARGTAGL
jgi:PAS domain S-box-containing protein